MKRATIAALSILTAAAPACAATCEETFLKTGSPIGGLRFIASVSVASLPPAIAIGQMRGIVVPKSYDVLAEEPEQGSMLIEQPMTGTARSFPIIVTALQEGGVGVVRLEAKLRTGMMVKEAAAKAEMCGILNQIKGGRDGVVAAAAGKTVVVGGGAPQVMSALAFSHLISKDTERNPAAVPLRYTGKAFTIWGTVQTVFQSQGGHVVAYRILNPQDEVIQIPGSAPFKTDLYCRMAPGQAAFALTLRPDKSIRLTGRWVDFDAIGHAVWLADCRPTS